MFDPTEHRDWYDTFNKRRLTIMYVVGQYVVFTYKKALRKSDEIEDAMLMDDFKAWCKPVVRCTPCMPSNN